MALLTAEDVLNKAFSKTKYREGFDQDEVDDFLDEVANSISALTAERDELQARLAQYQAGGVPSAPVAVQAPAQAAVPSAGLGSASADLLAAATDPNPPSATTMLSMAQRLHDDYVQAGEAERDRIIGEGKVKAEAIVEQAEKDARVRMQSLDAERADLERRIDDLRRFERDYRGHLRNYLENLLGDLEHNSARGAVDAPGAEPSKVQDAGAGLFAAASDEPEPLLAAPAAAGPFDSAPAEPEPFTQSEPEPFLAAPAAPGPFEAVAAEPEPFAPEPFAPAPTSPEPFAPTEPEPFLAAPAEPGPFVSDPAPTESFPPAAEPAQVSPFAATPAPTEPPAQEPAFPAALPPFPGTPQAAPAFPSPFTDANPFAPKAPAAEPADDASAPTPPASDDEAPRWNF